VRIPALLVLALIELSAGDASSAAVSHGAGTAPVVESREAATREVGSGYSTGPLQVLQSNRRYFTAGRGKAVLLAGSHTWSSLQNLGTAAARVPFDYHTYLDFLQIQNHNFFRLWVCALPHGTESVCDPFPWPRTGPGNATDGKLKFDLSRFNPAYFDLLRSRVGEAQERGIYVAVMLFDGYGVLLDRHPHDGYPLDQGNNINGISAPGTTSQDLSRPEVTAIQEAYVKEVVDTVGTFDNVLYEIANEAGERSTRWQYHMIELVKRIEAGKSKQHPVGMTMQLRGGDQELYDSPADWISPGEFLPPEADGRKVIINDTDHSFYYKGMLQAGQDVQRAWAWENFARGNSVAFMDPYLWEWPGRNAPVGLSLDPYWSEVRNAMTDIRNYSIKVNLANMTPHGGLVAGGGFCLASPGHEYLVFTPWSAQGSFLSRAIDKISRPFFNKSFTLTVIPGTYRYEWFNPSTHRIEQAGKVTLSGTSHTFTVPFRGAAVLWLRK
jgi:hypothetical protein